LRSGESEKLETRATAQQGGLGFRTSFYIARVRVWFSFVFLDVACLGIRWSFIMFSFSRILFYIGKGNCFSEELDMGLDPRENELLQTGKPFIFRGAIIFL
jgi:hypothetical protein